MPNQEATYVTLDGEKHLVRFSADLAGAKRAALGYPTQGTLCACPDCGCQNEADMGTQDDPICGCCLADCPDFHGADSP